MQCDNYIQDHGINMGCMLQNLSQAEYKDLSICVNGSVAATSLRPLYATLRLHNLGKAGGRAAELGGPAWPLKAHGLHEGLKLTCALANGEGDVHCWT